MTDAPVDISVIVATRNRAASLEDTLRSLAHQETGARFSYEVVVADNGSTDRTPGAVQSLMGRYPVPLRYAQEARPGKSHALNAGMRAARGAVFAFTDDDVEAAPAWLTGLWAALQETGAGAAGGRILPKWLGARPEWITDAYLKDGRLGCVDYGDRRVTSREDPHCQWVGGNVAIRRDVADTLGGYDVRMRRGQDTEFFRRCLQGGVTVVYEPSAVVYHKIPAERMTPRHFRRWCHESGYYHAYLPAWQKYHALTVTSFDWYAQTARLLASWLGKWLRRAPWAERFHDELYLRERWSHWWHRLQLLPAWWLALLTGRRHV